MRTVALLLILNLFFACNKNNEPSRTEILCDSFWVYKDVKKNGVSLFTIPSVCLFDNLYAYNKDGTFNVDENAVKCDPNSPQVESYPWYFFSNEDSMSINGLRVKLIELDKMQFITEFTNSANDKILYILGRQ